MSERTERARNFIETIPDSIHALNFYVDGTRQHIVELCEIIEGVEADRGEMLKALKDLIFTASKLWDDAKPIKDTQAMRVTHPIIEEAKSVVFKAEGKP